MTGPMVWTTKYGKVVLHLPDEVMDREEIDMALDAIDLQLRAWQRAMKARIAARWPFPEPSISSPAFSKEER